MKLLKPMDFLGLSVITLLLICDYFLDAKHSLEIARMIAVAFVVILVLRAVFAKRKDQKEDEIGELKGRLFHIIYIFILLGILTALGGESNSGISFYDWFFWVVVGVYCIDLYSSWKKTKKNIDISS
ncbi:hypothetical protein [Caldalkalibacillus mannanilyticus]|uniref:hypothetical protein n=1 Tax=Caldalkalibacillus mannanilyticus TaxID=1418 RepID=UPI000469730A|nr:hypothetical protein [Caldalkalibacillus mannanilyticus]